MANGTTPSTLNNASASDSGVAAALNGLFKTGIEFLGDNFFGGKKEDENAALREQNAKLLAAATQPTTVVAGGGGGLTPTVAFTAVGIGVVVILFVALSR